MSDKINVGQAVMKGENMELYLDIDKLLESLDIEEVLLATGYYVGKDSKPKRKLKLFLAKLDAQFTNKYQTHSCRIDTSYRQKNPNP